MKKLMFAAVLAAMSLVPSMAEGKLSVDKNGTISGGGVTFRMTCVNKSWAWRDNRKFKNINSTEKDGACEMKAESAIGDCRIGVSQSVSAEENGYRSVNGKFTFAPAHDIARCAYNVDFEVDKTSVEIDGKKLNFDKMKKKGIIFYKKSAKVLIRSSEKSELELLLPNTVVSIERLAGKNSGKASLKLIFSGSTGSLTESSCSFKAKVNFL